MMINAISTALSGLTASAKKADTAAGNIANISSSGALSSLNVQAPYQTQVSTQTSLASGGVIATNVTKSPGFVHSYDPQSPFANEEGLIGVPNTNLAEEIINLKTAEIAYKANVKTLEAAQNLSDELLSIFDEDS